MEAGKWQTEKTVAIAARAVFLALFNLSAISPYPFPPC